eukprot:748099-Hanusia_phi.AAC.1
MYHAATIADGVETLSCQTGKRKYWKRRARTGETALTELSEPLSQNHNRGKLFHDQQSSPPNPRLRIQRQG